MFNNIYVVKDKISGIMTSQLMVANNDLVAIKGFAESLKNVSKELSTDSVLYRLGSISENGCINYKSRSGVVPEFKEPEVAEQIIVCDSTNFEEKFNKLLEFHKDIIGEED